MWRVDGAAEVVAKVEGMGGPSCPLPLQVGKLALRSPTHPLPLPSTLPASSGSP